MENTNRFTNETTLGITENEIVRLQKMLKYMQITSPLDDFMDLKSELVSKAAFAFDRDFVLKCMDNGNLQPLVKKVEDHYFDTIIQGEVKFKDQLEFSKSLGNVYFIPDYLVYRANVERFSVYMYQPRGLHIKMFDLNRDTVINVQNTFNIYESEAFIIALNLGGAGILSITPVISGGKNGEPLLKISYLNDKCITTETINIKGNEKLESILTLFKG